MVFTGHISHQQIHFLNFPTISNSITGGWLNMEPWITPSIFQEVNVGENKNKIVDEYTYAQYVDPDYRKERLNR